MPRAVHLKWDAFIMKWLLLLFSLASLHATAQERIAEGTTVLLSCEVDRSAVRAAAASGGRSEDQIMETLRQADLVAFDVSYWQTTYGNCQSTFGSRQLTCVVTDRAIVFSFPDLPNVNGGIQAVLLDRFSGELRFLKYKNLQHKCAVRRKLF